MHAGQFATKLATNEKLEQQVGALAICTNTFTYMEAVDSDRVYPESVSSTVFTGRRRRQSAI